MTMVNSTVSNTPSRGGGVSLRKTNKPLMEKRRRARINDSLSQLKSLVIHSSKKDSSQFSKLEKADILELTVKHLRGLQAQQQQQQHHLHQHPLGVQPAPNGPAETVMNGKYRAGFVECANEVIRYLDQSQGLNQDTKGKVVSHLANCLQLVSASQPKIAPQPAPQQAVAPPANAAAILAAAAAAAGNATTTTTQLPNGQIIQIVSNPLQNVQTAAQGPTVLGLNPAPTPCSLGSLQGMNLSSQSDHSLSQPKAVGPHAQAAGKPAQGGVAQPGYIHYAQPLHIQIPPLVSPVLIQKPQITKQVELREPASNFSSSSTPSSSSSSSNQSSSPDQVHEVVSSSTSLAAPSPRTTTTPPSLYPGHPKARAQKQLNFYSQDDVKADSYSKSLNLSMTPSSSSSSETENTSPLNLSQSPPFLEFKTKQRQPSSYSSTMPSRKFHTQKQSVCPYPSKPAPSSEHRVFRDGSNLTFAPNATSVIVDSRKCGDFAEGKYWSMMEEDRHCLRQHNTPSPASSVGEERLWRPW